MRIIFNTGEFAPRPEDSVRELRWKAESMLEHLREQAVCLRQFPNSAIEERLSLWESLAGFLARAGADPALALDAQLEAQRVWAEEMHHAALNVITMCTYAQSEAAEARFANDPEVLEALLEKLERQRPAALRLLSTEDRNVLRAEGFLRPGE